MAVIIDDVSVAVLPPASTTPAGAAHPAERDQDDDTLDLLELAHERRRRLVCD